MRERQTHLRKVALEEANLSDTKVSMAPVYTGIPYEHPYLVLQGGLREAITSTKIAMEPCHELTSGGLVEDRFTEKW